MIYTQRSFWQLSLNVGGNTPLSTSRNLKIYTTDLESKEGATVTEIEAVEGEPVEWREAIPP